MAIAFGTIGAAAPGTTSLSIAYPASISAGDLLLMFITNKYPTNAPAQPSGWTTPANNRFSRGGGTAGADTGDVYITCFIREADGTETGNVSVTITSGNSAIGVIARYTKASTKGWEYALVGGSDNAAGTSWSVTAGANPGVTAGDMVLVASALCGNTDTATSEAISQTGVTFGTMVERQDSGTNNGDDTSLWLTEHPVNSGTGSAAPVYTATVGGTGSATAAGASIFVRLREVDPPLDGTLSVTLDNATIVTAGTVDVVGTLTKTLDNATIVAAGAVDVVGTLTKTLDNATIVAEGTVADAGINGELTKTLDNATIASTGVVDVTGVLSKTTDNATIISTGAVDVVGALSKTTDNATIISTGAVDVAGTLSKTTDNATILSTGVVDVTGTLSRTTDNATLVSEGSVGNIPISGELTKTLDNATISSSGAVAVSGAASLITADATGQSTGVVDVAGILAKTLDEATIVSTGAVAVSGTLGSQLLDATLAAAAGVLVSGIANVQLDDAVLEASGGEQTGVSGELILTLEDARTGYPQHYISSSRVVITGRDSRVVATGRKSRVH